MNRIPETSNDTPPHRIPAIDALRGLVIILMALDHSRDFFGDMRIVPDAAATTSLGLFLTRLVTHLCAPTFVFLAGCSAWLYGRKVSRLQLSRFLLTRGIWLLLLEFTVIYFSLSLSLALPWMFLVIAAIGTSMIALAGLVWLRPTIVLGLGLLLVAGHNLLDPISADLLGRYQWIWMLLHQPGYHVFENGIQLEIAYPVIAWIGVIACGYGTASLILARPSAQRRRMWLMLGLALLVSFVTIRMFNGYGNPKPWDFQFQGAASTTTEASPNGTTEATSNARPSGNSISEVDWMRTTFSFFATTKYPPSLAFLTMTLGTSLLLLGCLEAIDSQWIGARILRVYGSVPLFFYILHFYLLHLGSILAYRIFKGVWLSPFQTVYLFGGDSPFPSEFGWSTLWQIYVAWILLLIVMYPICRWYGDYKRRTKSWWLSYL